jgi:hypothetical protein
VGNLLPGEHWYVSAVLGTVDTQAGLSTFQKGLAIEPEGEYLNIAYQGVRKVLTVSSPLRL